MALCKKCAAPYVLNITKDVIDLTSDEQQPSTSGIQLVKPVRHLCLVCSLPVDNPGQTAHSQCLTGLTDSEEFEFSTKGITKVRCEVCTFVVDEVGETVHRQCINYAKKNKKSKLSLKGKGKRSK